MNPDPFYYVMAERVNFLTVDLRTLYEKEHGGYHDWDDFTDEIFFLNSDVNLEAEINNEGGHIHPLALKYGLTRGISEIHFHKDSYYSVVTYGDNTLLESTKTEYLYDTMIWNISNFIFNGK